MSEKVQAAQKWAEAKESLEKAQAAHDAALEAMQAAVQAEADAWEALQYLSGRRSAEIVSGPIAIPRPINEERAAFRHSLPARPIG